MINFNFFNLIYNKDQLFITLTLIYNRLKINQNVT